jgi:mono/diheme cytochrome c family protein
MRIRCRAEWLALALIAACSDGGAGSPQAALVSRGRAAYQADCAVCHAQDPAVAGPVGPALAGSSLELLRAKVLRNEYPAGYTPKRSTRAMFPLVHREPDLRALAAYLESVVR